MQVFTPSPAGKTFDLAKWEKEKNAPGAKKKPATAKTNAKAAGAFVKGRAGASHFSAPSSTDDANPHQFILLQLNDEPGKHILRTTEVTPKFEGASATPDVAMTLDFDGFKIGSDEDIDRKTKATLQLTVGQVQNVSSLDKLFFCLNAGLDLYNNVTGKKSESKDFKKTTAEALGKKQIILPGGIGEISLKVVKHQEPKWWQKIFGFAKSAGGKELLSLIGFPGITEAALTTVGNLLDSLFDQEPEVLFSSLPVKIALSKAAQAEMSGGLTTSHASCLNAGYWIMAKQSDYEKIIDANPIYYSGFGILAPDGMTDIEAIRDSANNPFSKMTYSVIRAKAKEVNLNQNIIL